jgi:hypothetical protein
MSTTSDRDAQINGYIQDLGLKNQSGIITFLMTTSFSFDEIKAKINGMTDKRTLTTIEKEFGTSEPTVVTKNKTETTTSTFNPFAQPKGLHIVGLKQPGQLKPPVDEYQPRKQYTVGDQMCFPYLHKKCKNDECARLHPENVCFVHASGGTCEGDCGLSHEVKCNECHRGDTCFDENCMYGHPKGLNHDPVQNYRDHCGTKPCDFGSNCNRTGCWFNHDMEPAKREHDQEKQPFKPKMPSPNSQKMQAIKRAKQNKQ